MIPPNPRYREGATPSRTLPQHGLRPCAGAQAPRMLRPPRIKNPPRIWAGYGPVPERAKNHVMPTGASPSDPFNNNLLWGIYFSCDIYCKIRIPFSAQSIDRRRFSTPSVFGTNTDGSKDGSPTAHCMVRDKSALALQTGPGYILVRQACPVSSGGECDNYNEKLCRRCNNLCLA